MSWFGLFDKTTDLISEAIEDKDKLNTIKGKLGELKEQVYMKELDTKTVPWVDALHKMGRQIGNYLSYALCAYMIHKGITDPIALGACFAPGGIYAAFKNKGK
jgi:hypothetical protein